MHLQLNLENHLPVTVGGFFLLRFAKCYHNNDNSDNFDTRLSIRLNVSNYKEYKHINTVCTL
jgi:hypothetical protein